MTLVSNWVREIVTINISEIVLNGNFGVRNIVTIFEVLLELLHFLENLLELLIAFSCEFFGAGEGDWIRVLLGE